jgi:hypothetical protein
MKTFAIFLTVASLMLGLLGNLPGHAANQAVEATEITASAQALTAFEEIVGLSDNGRDADDCRGRIHVGSGGCSVDAAALSTGFEMTRAFGRYPWSGSNSRLRKTSPAPEPPPPIYSSMS